MKFNFLRHLIFTLGNSEKESLQYCNDFDNCSSDVEKIMLIQVAMERCKDKLKVENVKKKIGRLIK